MKVIAAIVGLISVLFFFLMSVTVNGQPDMSPYRGWVEVLQPPDMALENNHQVQLRVDPVTPGAPGSHPELLYTVVVCSVRDQPFQGVLLLGGDARLRDARAIDSTLSNIGVRELPNLALGHPGNPLSFGPVQVVQIDIEHPVNCASDDPTDLSEGFGGSPTQVSGRSLAPIQRAWDLAWWSGPHSGQAWPLVGAIPGLPPTVLGQFDATEGLSGSWHRVLSQRNLVVSGGLTGRGAIELARPTPTDPSQLTWKSLDPIQPIARVTDLDELNAWQTWQVAAAIGLGIGGSLLAGLLLATRRPQERASEVGTADDRELQGNSVSTSGHHDHRKTGRMVVLAFGLGLLLGATATAARSSRRVSRSLRAHRPR